MSNIEQYEEIWQNRYNQEHKELIEAKRKELKEQKKSSQEINDILEGEEFKARLNSQATFRAAARLSRQASTMGQTMLIALWKAHQDHLQMWVDESENIWGAMQKSVEGMDVDRDYLKAMCMVIDRGMFDFINDRENDEKPIKVKERKLTMQHETDTEWLNPLSSPGLVGKLKENSAHFIALDEDQKEKFMIQIFTESRMNLKVAKEINRGENFTLKVTVKEDGEKITVALPKEIVLTKLQYRKFKSRLKQFLEIA
jgi:hypothetical protein